MEVIIRRTVLRPFGQKIIRRTVLRPSVKKLYAEPGMSRNGDFQSSDESGDFNKNDNNAVLSPSSHRMMEKDLPVDDFFPYGDGNNSQYVTEINRLQHSNKLLKAELQAEQDSVLQLRKKLNQVEKQKLETASQSNNEISSLETQIAKLRSQLEKGEAARHNLEYELTKSQRETNSIKENAKKKETLFIDGTDELKQKIGDLNDEVQKAKKSLHNCQANAEENGYKSKQMIEETVLKLSKTETELESAKSEKDRLNDLCQKHSNIISELNEKLQEYESDKRNVIDNLRRATAELEYAKEREERLKSELEGTFARIKSLEEIVEAERAAHLETKFNSEIVQLRVRDLDGAIDVEKSANAEANKAIERITKQNRELEQVYDEERKTRKDLNNKIDKLEKEYMSVRRQLSSEVDDKKSVIGNLSKELESHQKNFNELKSELSKAKKRQMFLEETYGGSIKELEFLLKTFHFDDKRLKIATRKDDLTGTSTKGTKPANPSVIVENFKQMLIQLKKRLDTQSDELIKAKKTAERLSKDLDSSREIIKAKDKTLEDTQKNYTKAAKDLNKARTNYSDLESTISKLKTSLHANASTQDKDKIRIQELTEEMMRLVKRHQADEEEKIAFLHGLYQRLLSSHIIVKAKDKVFNQFSWSELTETVYEQVSELVDLLNNFEDKLKQTHNSARSREDAFVSLKREHEEQISKLTNMAREREASWQRQKQELEQHYNGLLSDLQSRSKKTQAIADQAWEKVRATGSVQQGLESEVVELRRELAESQVQASSLLSACALLSGALFPLYTKSAMLSSERHMLDELFSTWDTCKDRALYLSSVLSSGKDSDQDQPERDSRFLRKGRLLLRFRVGVIAVLAANRLAFLGSSCTRCFVTYSSNIDTDGLQVSTGGLDIKRGKIGAIDTSQYEQTMEDTGFGPASDAEKGLGPWLKSQELLEIVVGSMTELQEALRVNKEESNRTEMKLVVTASRSSFTKFIDRLAYFFPSPSLPIQSSLRERSSLLRKLERHLSCILSNTPHHMKGSLVTLQEVMSSLQNHILDLTQRLHSAEKERRHLLSDLNELKNQIGEESNSYEGTKEKVSSGKQGTKYVAMEKFEKVCIELSSALRREQKAQALLQEQSNQLTQLTSKLDMCVSDEMQMQNRLVQGEKNITEFQQQLRHKDQNLRQIGKQLAQIEYERESLTNNLKDAENALRTALRDKEILAQYIRSVETALDTAKRQFLILREPAPLSDDVSLSHLLLNAELIPPDIGKAGPELIAVQNLVGAFVDAQHQAVNKIRSLEEEIVSHKEHITSLKRELSNAVQREFSDQVDFGSDGTQGLPGDSDKSGKELFLPLKDDSDMSFESLPTPSKAVAPMATSLGNSYIQQSKKSAFHSVNSGAPFSPRKSPRP